MGRKAKEANRLKTIIFDNSDGSVDVFHINEQGVLENADIIKNMRAPRNSYKRQTENRQNSFDDNSNNLNEKINSANLGRYSKRKACKEARIDLPQYISDIQNRDKPQVNLTSCGTEIADYSTLPFSLPSSANISEQISSEPSASVSRQSSEQSEPLINHQNIDSSQKVTTTIDNDYIRNYVRHNYPVTERAMFHQLFTGLGLGVSVDDFIDLQNSRQRIMFVEDFCPPCFVP
ncbi:hypothetical protein TRFO_27999 [Tritrichomonas foetus]|uniref:Uncharacterized protein n=1 Tax=Tritrichomonas foetus TaxID=1144522 RepID=A0A1J4K181_9EUKA|nr:hypothetical protein TRFO_27999 [Tritrichomonas foetus]|eukprot:OHT04544.1 hypothetical protein TRFO_27999 [Tritrichomonas foetus]